MKKSTSKSCLPACLPLALALAGFGNAALAAGAPKKETPVVVNSVERALKGLQPSLNKNKESALAVKKFEEFVKDLAKAVKAPEEAAKARAEATIKSRKLIDDVAKATNAKAQEKLKAAETLREALIKEKEGAKTDEDKNAIEAKITDVGVDIKAAQDAITKSEEAMLEAHLKTIDAEGKIAIANGKIVEIEKKIADADQKIAAAEKAITTANVVTALLDTAKLTAEEKKVRMNAIGGQFYASTHSVLLADHHLRNVVQAHLPGAAVQPVLTASNGNVPVGSAVNAPAARTWANGWGYDGKTSKNQGASLNHKGSGFAVGVDTQVANNVAAGALLAFEDGKVANDKTLYAHTKLKSYSVGSYVSAEAGGVTLAGGLLYSKLDFTSARDMNKIAAGAGEARASYKGHKVQAFAEVAHAFELGTAGTVSPYLTLTQTWLHTDAAKEKGTVLLPLQVKAQNTSALQSTLGARTRVRLPVATPVSVTANLGWAHTFAKSVKASTRIVTAAGVVSDEMSLKGQAMSKDRALIGVGVEAQVAKNATLALAYDGQFGSKYKDHTGSLQVKVRF